MEYISECFHHKEDIIPWCYMVAVQYKPAYVSSTAD